MAWRPGAAAPYDRPVLNRFGLLGDVHQQHERLEAALGYFDAQGIEAVLCTGDIVDGLGDAERTIGRIRARGVECVMGNHERWFLKGSARDLPDALPLGALGAESREYLAALPRTRTYPTPAGPLLLCHGMGPNDMGGLHPDEDGYGLEMNDDVQRIVAAREVAVVLAGHTHRRMVRILGGVVIVNAGTLLGEHDPVFAIVDLAAGEVRFVDARDPAALGAGSPIRLASRAALG